MLWRERLGKIFRHPKPVETPQPVDPMQQIDTAATAAWEQTFDTFFPKVSRVHAAKDMIMATQELGNICRLTLRSGRPFILDNPGVHAKTLSSKARDYHALLEMEKNENGSLRLSLIKYSLAHPGTQDFSLVSDFSRHTLALKVSLIRFPEAIELEDPVKMDPDHRTLIENGTVRQGKFIDEDKQTVLLRGYEENFGPNAAMMVRIFSEEALLVLQR